MKSSVNVLLVLLASLMLVSSASAYSVWQPVGTGALWSNGANWNGGAPTSGSSVYVQSSGGPYTVPEPGTGTPIDFPGGEDWAVNITSAVNFTAGNALGQIDVGIWGSGPDVPSYVKMTGGSIVTTARIAVGHDDGGYTGIWEQSGGYTNSGGGGFFLGYGSGARGEAYISGGELHAPGDGLRFHQSSGLLEISGTGAVYADRIQNFEPTQDEVISIKDDGKLYLTGNQNPSTGAYWVDWVRGMADQDAIIGYDGDGDTIVAEYNSSTGKTEVWTDDVPIPVVYSAVWRPLTTDALWAISTNWDDSKKPTPGTTYVTLQSVGGPYTVPDPGTGVRIPFPAGEEWGPIIDDNVDITDPNNPIGDFRVGAWGSGTDQTPTYVNVEGGALNANVFRLGAYDSYPVVWNQTGGVVKSLRDGFFLSYDNSNPRVEVYVSGGELHAYNDGLRFHQGNGLLEISGTGAVYADRILSFAVFAGEDDQISLKEDGRLYLTGQSNPSEPYTWADWVGLYADSNDIIGEDGTGDSVVAYYDSQIDKTVVMSMLPGNDITVTDLDNVAVDDGQDDYVGLQVAVDTFTNVYLPAGTYNISQTIYLPSGCRIYGDSAGKTIIMMDADTVGFRVDGQDDVKISRLAIVRPPQFNASMDEMIFVYGGSSNVLIDGVKLTGARSRSSAIFFHESNFGTVINSAIYDYQRQMWWSDIEGQPEEFQTYGAGISFWGCTDVIVRGNYVEETEDMSMPSSTYKPYYQAAGIQVSGCSRGVVADNRVKYSGNGIDVGSSDNLTVHHNYIYNVNQAGIKLVNGSSDMTVSDNHLERCELVGIWLTPGSQHLGCDNNTVEDNILDYTGYGFHTNWWAGWFGNTVPAGIHLDAEDTEPAGQSTDNTVINNRFYNNDRMLNSVIVVPGTYPAINSTISGNTIEAGNPSPYILNSDVNSDDSVDDVDLLLLAGTWLDDCNPGALNTDLNMDGKITLPDLAEFGIGYRAGSQ